MQDEQDSRDKELQTCKERLDRMLDFNALVDATIRKYYEKGYGTPAPEHMDPNEQSRILKIIRKDAKSKCSNNELGEFADLVVKTALKSFAQKAEVSRNAIQVFSDKGLKTFYKAEPPGNID